MAREFISLETEMQQTEENIRHQISSGQLTNEVYDTLDAGLQALVRKVLFEMHAQPVAPPVALSGLEFLTFGFAKLYFRSLENEPLNEKEQAFFETMKALINQHEMTLDAEDWYLGYIHQTLDATKKNRENYKKKKMEIVGEF